MVVAHRPLDWQFHPLAVKPFHYRDWLDVLCLAMFGVVALIALFVEGIVLLLT